MTPQYGESLIYFTSETQYSMSRYCFETPYGSRVSRVVMMQYPRRAIVTLIGGDVVYEFRMKDPRPLACVCAAMEDCYQIRVLDNDPQLNFGRYKIEIWDEDNSYAEFNADAYELVPVDAAPVA